MIGSVLPAIPNPDHTKTIIQSLHRAVKKPAMHFLASEPKAKMMLGYARKRTNGKTGQSVLRISVGTVTIGKQRPAKNLIAVALRVFGVSFLFQNRHGFVTRFF
jgi:hypothetical protein